MTEARRKELCGWIETGRDLYGGIILKECLDEIDRLRAALKVYACKDNWTISDVGCDVWHDKRENPMSFARKALGEEGA